MGGLDPDVLECDEAARLSALQNALGRKLFRGVIGFRVSEHSPFLLALLKVCCREPIFGAEDAPGITYEPEDRQ